jgi:hypothetical protein
MKPTVNFITNDLAKQAEYLCFLAKSISFEDHSSTNFYITPTLVTHHPRTIYFPDLPYSKAFWKLIKQSSNPHYGLPFPKPAVLEAKHLLKNLPLPTPSHPLIKSWASLQPQIINSIQSIINHPNIKKISTINLLLSPFGSCGSYNPIFNDNHITINLTCRVDLPVSEITKTLLLAIESAISEKIAVQNDLSWHQRQSIAEFLATNTKLNNLINHQSPPITPKIIKANQAYLAKLGFPSNPILTQKNHQIFVNQKPINSLTPQEKRLLTLLIKYQNQLVTFDQAADAVWQDQADDKYSLYALSKLIENLRKKITLSGINHQLIHTKRGQGYLLIN